MKQKLFFLFAIVFILNANSGYGQSQKLDVNDISWPSTLNLNIGQVDEFVYVLKNGGTGGRMDSIIFDCTKNSNIAYYLHSGYPVFYLRPDGNDILGSVITKYFYHYDMTNTVYHLNAVGDNIIDSNMIKLATGKGYLAPGDSIVLHIPFTVTICNSSNGENLFRDSLAAFRDTVPEFNSINVQPGFPTLGATTEVIDSASFCSTLPKHFCYIKFHYKNAGHAFAGFLPGNGQADSLRIYLYSTIGVGTIDPASIKINNTTVNIGNIISYTTPSLNVYVIDLTNYPAGANGHPFGYSTICDMNGNGVADGLAEDSTFDITAKFLYDSINCLPFVTDASPVNLSTFYCPGIGTKYTNMCYTDIYDSLLRLQVYLPGDASYEYQTSTSPATTATAPSDLTSSVPNFNYIICPHFFQAWYPHPFNFDCPNPNWSIAIPLPRGYQLDTSSSNLSYYAHRNGPDSNFSNIWKYLPFLTDSSWRCTTDTFPFKPPVMYEHYHIDSTQDTVFIDLGKLPVSACGAVDFSLTTCIDVPLELDCKGLGSSNIYTASDDQLNFYLVYTCDSGCVKCQDTLTSGNAITYHHCPGSCTSIPYTDSIWTFFRTNFGSINEDSTQIQYYSTCNAPYYAPGVLYPLRDTVNINYEAAYPGDQILAYVAGGYAGLVPSSYSNEYLQIRYSTLVGSQNLFELDPDIQSYFILRGFTGSLSVLNGKKLILPPYAPVYTDTASGTLVEMNFSLDSAIRHTYPFLYDTSWVTDTHAESFTDTAFIHLRVVPAPVLTVGYGRHLLNLRTEFMCKQVGPNTSGDTVHSCDSWGRKFNIYRPNDGYGWAGIPVNYTNCNLYSLNVGIIAQPALSWSIGGSDFPYEFRPFYELDSVMTFTIPKGYLFSSVQLNVGLDNHDTNWYNNHFSGGYTQYTIPIIPFSKTNPLNNPDSITKIVLKGVNTSCWPLIDQKVNPYYPSLTVNLNLQPVCFVADTEVLHCSTGVTLCTQQTDPNFQVKEGPRDFQMVLIHQNPVVSITAPSTISDYSNLISFTFNTCDLTSYNATNTWIAFENFNHYELNLSTAKLRDSNSHVGYPGIMYYNADTGIIFNIGLIRGSMCDTLTFSALIDSNSISCPPPAGGDKGKQLVRFGNICTGILLNPDSTPCQKDTVTFHYNVYPAGLLLTNLGYRPNPISLCGDTLVDSLTIYSDQLGTITDPSFWTSLPPGVSFCKVVFAYPCGEAWDTTLYRPDLYSGSITGGGITGFGWNLDNDLHITGLQGTFGGGTSVTGGGSSGGGIEGTNPNSTVCVKVYMIMNCGYKDSAIKFYTIGTTTCGHIDTAIAKVTPIVDSSCCAPKIPKCVSDTTKFDLVLNNKHAHSLSSSFFYNLKILVIDTFTVDRYTFFTNCDVQFAPNAVINVINRDTLQIEATGYDGCTHFHAACDSMWQGINIYPGSYMYTDNWPLIEDAKQAIVAYNAGTQQGIYNIHHSVFNKNYKDIVVHKCATPYYGGTWDCIYTCRNLSAYFDSCSWYSNWRYAPFDTILPPYSGRTAEGWEIDSVNHFVDGKIFSWLYSPPSGQNVFDNMNIGILSQNSNTFIYADTFQYINSPSFIQPAILATGNTFSFFRDTLIVGGPTALSEPNIFRHCTTGVLAAFGFNEVNVSYNRFHFDDTSATYGIITMGPMKLFSTITIDSNIIDSAAIGIIGSLNQFTTAHIDSNTIIGAGLCGGQSGIFISELAGTHAVYNIENNKINDLFYGVYLNDVDSATIYQNNIFMTDSICNMGIGIAVNGGMDEQIVANTVSMTYHSSPTPYMSDGFYGIYVGNSADNFISCDSTFYVNIGIDCDGPGDNGLFFDVLGNQMTAGPNTNFSFGIALTNMSLIGQQGSSGAPSDNQWLDPTNFTCNSIVPLPTNTTLSPFFVHAGATYNPVGGSCAPQITPDTTSGPFYSCVNAPPIVLRMAISDSIATNQINYLQTPDTSSRLAKHALTKTLWKRSTLLNFPLMHHFNDSINSTSLGQIMAVDTAMNGTSSYNPSILLSNLNSITPASNVEANMQATAQIYLQAPIASLTTLPQNQLNALGILANKCPNFDGPGVYEARTLLGYYGGGFTAYFDNDCSNDRNRHHFSKTKSSVKDTVKEITFNLYPNPNNGNFTLTYDLSNESLGRVEIYNQIGMKVAEYLLNSPMGTMQISVPNLNQGLYIYKLFTNSGIKKVGKIIIMK